jgi:hypothetical protein
MDKRTDSSIRLLCAATRKALANLLCRRGSKDAQTATTDSADSAKSLDEIEMRRDDFAVGLLRCCPK